MEARDIEKYRKKLIAEKDHIRKEIEALDAVLDFSENTPGQSELADYDQHPADDGTDTFEKEKDVSVRANWHDVMVRVDEAIEKIERGSYGQCDRCGIAIPKERLNAMPYAVYCIECQDAIEGR